MKEWINFLNFFGFSFIGIGMFQFWMRIFEYKMEMKVKINKIKKGNSNEFKRI
jgi:hypothetical protein